MKRRLFGLVSAVVLAATSVPSFTVFAADDQKMGTTNDGYDYEAWNQDYKGQWSMTPGNDGCFTCNWSGIFNFLGRMGKRFTEKKSYKAWGDVELDYEVKINPRGNVYMCVYGWTQNPLVEYYIVEGWGSWRPPGGQGQQGSINVNNKGYDVYKSMRNNQPSIEGNKTFPQYWSVAQSSCMSQNRDNTCSGTISISKHFQAWDSKGMDMSGSLYEVALNMEGYGGGSGDSSANCTITKNKLYINGVDLKGNKRDGSQGETPGTSDPGTSTPATSDGKFFKESFDSGKGDWTARQGNGGSVSLTNVTDSYAEGSGSLKVSGRGDSWNGAGLSLSTSTYVPGQTYSFYAAVMQNVTSSTSFKLSMQYDDGSGTQYDKIGTVTGNKGEWAKIGGDYTIPSGASNLLLYIETETGTDDFYFDSASSAKGGTACSIDLSKAKVGESSSSSSDPGTSNPGTSDPGTSTPGSSGGDWTKHQNLDYTFTPGGQGLKDVFGPYFRMGTSVSGMEIGDSNAQNFIKQNFNSITCENEMKPDQIIKGINGSSVNVDIGSAANQLKFAEQNGIGVRGHTFIWHSQTPNGMYQGDKSTSDARIDSFIKQTFEQIKSRYPNLKLYAYDVANEVFKNDGGGLRVKNGGGNDTSQWTNIYGENNDGHIFAGFRAARQYAPATCKLYLNDYNEYVPAKRDNLYDMAKKLDAEGLIDGIGMQSHLDAKYPDKTTYEDAVKKFASLGLDVQITELDITNNQGGGEAMAKQLWIDVYTIALTYADHISSLTMWGTTDARSWRSGQGGSEGGPLMFKNYQAKQVVNDVKGLVSKFPVTTKGAVTTTSAPATTKTTTTTTTTTTAPTPVETTKPQQSAITVSKRGDVTCDNKVDVSDAVLLARFLNNDSKATVTDQGIANADADKSGKVDIDDITKILEYIAKLCDL